MAEIELRVGESIIEEVKGDYWEKFLFIGSQNRGKFVFTNQRIHAKVGFANEFDLEYKDIKG